LDILDTFDEAVTKSVRDRIATHFIPPNYSQGAVYISVIFKGKRERERERKRRGLLLRLSRTS